MLSFIQFILRKPLVLKYLHTLSILAENAIDLGYGK